METHHFQGEQRLPGSPLMILVVILLHTKSITNYHVKAVAEVNALEIITYNMKNDKT